MEQLFELMNTIISSDKSKGFKTCSELLENSEYTQLVKNYLSHLGFNISKMSFDNIAILFFGILDTLVIVSENDCYFATLSSGVVDSLRHEGRLLPRSDENETFDKTFKMMQGQTFESINTYLEKGKFKLIKLLHEETCKHTNFICRASLMNPYPDLCNCKVYSLLELAYKYNNLVNNLVTGVLNISTDTGDIVVTCMPTMTDGKQLNYTCTSCYIYCRNLDGVLVEIPFWKIKDYSVYEPNQIVLNLMSGIYRVKRKNDDKSKGTLVTMNKNILTKYYGNKYLRLESLGVRQRYAYENMLSLGFKSFDISFYYQNYYFYTDSEMKGISTYNDLKEYLKNAIISTDNSQYNGCIHPRVLGSYGSILSGHTSFYLTIKNTDDYIFEEVNPDDVLPKLYYVSGLTKECGYKVVQVESSFESSVEEIGRKEIERQAGEVLKILSIYCVRTDTYIKGKSIYSFSIDIQKKICEKLTWGYGNSFSLYAPLIRELCLAENITYNVSDDAIKYLFVNNIARKCPKSSNLTLPIFAEYLINFLDMLKYNEVDTKLTEELTKLSRVKLKKCYVDIENMIKLGCSIDDIGKRYNITPSDGVFKVQTNYGVLTIKLESNNKLVLSHSGVLMHNNANLGNVRF